jgi:hypothetical protein
VDVRVVSSDVVRARELLHLLDFHAYFYWIFLIFKGLSARRLYKSFGDKGLIPYVPAEQTAFSIRTLAQQIPLSRRHLFHISDEYEIHITVS